MLRELIVRINYKFGNFVYYKIQIPIIRQILWAIYKIFFILIQSFLGTSIPAKCRIGKKLILGHGGEGVIIHRDTIIGDEVTIYHQVTLGSDALDFHSIHDRPLTDFPDNGAPIIGNRVLIGAGAKIIGHITIGDDVRIGANAVVVHNIPPRAVVVGNPAKIVKML